MTRRITMVDVFFSADILNTAVLPSGSCFVIFCDFELKSSKKKTRVLLDICVCSGRVKIMWKLSQLNVWKVLFGLFSTFLVILNFSLFAPPRGL